MTDVMRSDCVPVAAVVLAYSFSCLSLNTILLFMLWKFGERFTYVALISVIMAVSTIASIIQQLHYVISWRYTVVQGYEASLKSVGIENPGFGATGNRMDVVLFLIQFYCYNVASMLVLFWAWDLFQRCWGLHIRWLGRWSDRLPWASKGFAVVLPMITMVLISIPKIVLIRPLYYLFVNIIIGTSLSTGAVLLILILYKYMQTRRILVQSGFRSAWWYAPNNGGTETIASTTTDTAKSSYGGRRALYDRTLIIRFTLAFCFLAAFEIVVIVNQMVTGLSDGKETPPTEPNFSKSGTIATILEFIPGVTASLAIFLIIGTTKSWSAYKDLILTPFSRCRSPRKDNEEPDWGNDEAPLTFITEPARSVPLSPYSTQSMFDDEPLGGGTGDKDGLPRVTISPLRSHATNLSFSRPIVPNKQLNTFAAGNSNILAPIVHTSTTIEVKSTPITSAYAPQYEGGIFDGSSLPPSNIMASSPRYNEAHGDYELGPEVKLGPSFNTTRPLNPPGRSGSQQAVDRDPTFFWDSSSDKDVK